MKMSFSCIRGGHFQGFRPPRSIQKSMKKTIEKWNIFVGPLLEGLGTHSVTILESKSHLKIDQKINAILDRFLDDFGPIMGSMWGPFALRDATGTPPRRSKTLSRRSQDAPKTLKDANKGTPRGPKRAQHASKLDVVRFFIKFSSIFHRCFH